MDSETKPKTLTLRLVLLRASTLTCLHVRGMSIYCMAVDQSDGYSTCRLQLRACTLQGQGRGGIEIEITTVITDFPMSEISPCRAFLMHLLGSTVP